jgi:hypothetical protein
MFQTRRHLLSISPFSGTRFLVSKPDTQVLSWGIFTETPEAADQTSRQSGSSEAYRKQLAFSMTLWPMAKLKQKGQNMDYNICATFYIVLNHCRSLDSVVGIATVYGLDDRGVGVRVPVGSRIFSSPRRPDRPWGLPNFLSNGYWGLFPRG